MYAYIDAAADDLSPDTNSGDAALLDVRAAAETTGHDSSEIDRTVGEMEESASQASSAEAVEAVDNNRLEGGAIDAGRTRRGNPVLEEVFGHHQEHDGMAQAETPPGLTTPLMVHQKMALGWMLRREEAERVAHTWWEQVDGGLYGFNTPLWVNLLTGQDRPIDQPPLEARGGILADDMGLGKTLTILALIVSDLGAPLPPTASSMAPAASAGEDSECCQRPTLVVCPLSVLHNWQKQIDSHTNKALRVMIYHGAGRTRDVQALSHQHMVLTTYSVLQSDMRASRLRDEAGSRASVLHAVHWHRVVLDEAHVIANPKAKQSKAVMMLQADRRWAVTGTPLQNKMDDLMTLFAFLRIEPLDDPEWFRRLVADPSRSKYPQRQMEGLQVVRSVLTEYCLRRTKHQRIHGAPILSLPGKEEVVRRLQLSEAERTLYDHLFQSGKAMFRTCMREGSVMTSYTKILERLLRLRQLCNHPSLLPTAAATSAAGGGGKGGGGAAGAGAGAGHVVSEDEMEVQRLVDVLEARLETGEEECCVCLEPIEPTSAVITKCAHIFCSQCLQRCLRLTGDASPAPGSEAGGGRCPLCRTDLCAHDVVAAPVPATALTLISEEICDPLDPASPRRLVPSLVPA